MVRDLLNKVFRKEAKRVGSVPESIHSAVIHKGERSFAFHPMTATEKTVARINEYRRTEGLEPL